MVRLWEGCVPELRGFDRRPPVAECGFMYIDILACPFDDDATAAAGGAFAPGRDGPKGAML